MTKEEADGIAMLISTADGGCSVCIGNMLIRANKLKLGWTFSETNETWREYWDSTDPEDYEYSTFPLIKAEPSP
jgi:hypothetical protein